jgi:hypothetical protein
MPGEGRHPRNLSTNKSDNEFATESINPESSSGQSGHMDRSQKKEFFFVISVFSVVNYFPVFFSYLAYFAVINPHASPFPPICCAVGTQITKIV